ncbi:DNA-methyltransferase [Microbacter margulisiae]|uniref:Methyltransferase n=1 Tax=Microbacter margulisiae TaxID=1350067 RepID=A0A7W5DQJ0_9PORP|nr:DNA methyltransferase [Microbacter margulisiae]MBB3186729.1 site-specific DNA-methyltransferase (adenine-specific) [Microbacter margulisiae]
MPVTLAPRNRTLLVTEEERSLLKELLIDFSESIPVVALNQIDNRIICGDTIAVLPKLPQAFADLIIVDPPYNLTRKFGDQVFAKTSFADYVSYLQRWFSSLVACLKPNGSIYVCGDWQSSSAIQMVMGEYVTLLNRITWQREKGRGAANNWKNGMEDIWFGVKDPKHYYFNVDVVKMKRKVIAPYRKDGKPKDWIETDDGNFRITHPSNFWDDITIPYWSMRENTEHPTQKPEKLIAKLILASSQEGDVVFDPFLGSGTTAVVAKKLNRHFCGVEMDETYCCVAQKRLQIADYETSIQGYEDGVFWERNTLSSHSKKRK